MPPRWIRNEPSVVVVLLLLLS